MAPLFTCAMHGGAAGSWVGRFTGHEAEATLEMTLPSLMANKPKATALYVCFPSLVSSGDDELGSPLGLTVTLNSLYWQWLMLMLLFAMGGSG